MKRTQIKKIMLLLMILFSVSMQTSAENTDGIDKTKTWCISLIGKSFTDISEVKSLLHERAKNAVIDDLFNMIVLKNNPQSVSMQRLSLRQYFAESVKVSDDLEYKNGSQFGEVCVTLQGKVSNDAIIQYRPFNIKKSYCFFDENITLKTLKLKTKQQAILQALYDYDERLRGKRTEDLLGLAHNIDYGHTGFSTNEEKYCVDVSFDVLPVEINIFKKQQMNRKLSFQTVETVVSTRLYPYLAATISTQDAIRQGSVQRLIEQINTNNQDEILQFFLKRMDSMIAENHQNGIYNACVIMANLENRVLVKHKNKIMALYEHLKQNENQWVNTLAQLNGIFSRLN
ncbi:MAG: hypothetical protein OMM_00263 [Candidatus Magnetoglobus multicellularis str. Araruama]|uniref:Uncharacterized protein n=1 Tax=Candidatus Magnetoglobus multicellularis str. Araruama TaxID=890399 RepID=A0A1V1PHV3_9BACT|nr:MAG: hypothetical protein OMM_00263 [Candidatus Magnetoglobus multicellularis str. Araruama]